MITGDHLVAIASGRIDHFSPSECFDPLQFGICSYASNRRMAEGVYCLLAPGNNTSGVMKPSLAQKLQILVLGALFAVGVALSATHGTEMTVKPPLASEPCLASASDKNSCDMGDDADSTVATCSSICPAATVAIMGSQAELAKPGVDKPLSPPLALYASISPAPDPSPPKSVSKT